MTLRARLIVALLAFALVPTVILTLLTLGQLDFATEGSYFPGVNRALESALVITKETLTRLETTVVTQAGDWAATWPQGAMTSRREEELRAALRSSGLDFAQVYRRDSSGWTRTSQITPTGVIAAAAPDLGPEIDAALHSGQPLRSPRGALAGIATLPDHQVLVVGAWVSPGFFSQVDQVVRTATGYRRLSITTYLQRYWVWVCVVGMVAILVVTAILFARSQARKMSRPIADLSSAIGRVAGGDLSTRVVPGGALELRSLGRSFNSMAESLETAREALGRAEREAAWRDAARKVAHELKNVLTPMQISLQDLAGQLDSVAETRRETADQNLRAAMRGIDGMKRLAEQFAHYARLPEPNLERLDLGELARSAARLDSRGDIRVAAGPEVWVRGDRVLLTRAIHNLVLNASEACAAGAPVEIRVGADAEEAFVEVLDRGPGLAPELRERLFEPYVSTKRRGSGLGLSLVRDIALQHGGTVGLENRPEGGACARLTLRLMDDPAPGKSPA